MRQEKPNKKTLCLAGLSYLGFLCVIPLIFAKNNKFILHHSRQGVALFALEVLAVLLGIVPFFGIYIQPTLLQVFILVSLWGMLNALLAKETRIFFIYKLSQKIQI